MSLSGWYLHKADQCGRMAKEAADSQRSAAYGAEQKIWLEIADGITGDEERRFGPEPR
jgi:hypothetical protein